MHVVKSENFFWRWLLKYAFKEGTRIPIFKASTRGEDAGGSALLLSLILLGCVSGCDSCSVRRSYHASFNLEAGLCRQ